MEMSKKKRTVLVTVRLGNEVAIPSRRNFEGVVEV